MKKYVFVLFALVFFVSACQLSNARIEAAIQQTQSVENAIQEGIALTLAAAVTDTPASTNTPASTDTPVSTNTPEETATPEFTATNTKPPYVSPTATLKNELTLEIKNKCDKDIHVKVTGPISYDIIIKGHTSDIRQIPRGLYHFWSDSGREFDQELNVNYWIWKFCYYN